jgi:alpha-glucosidase
LLPVPPSYATRNVEDEEKDPNSILNFFRRLIELRRTNPALHEGRQVSLNEADPNVLSYLREFNGRAVVVVLNMSASPQSVSYDLTAYGVTGTSGAMLLSNVTGASSQVELKSLRVPGYGAFVFEIGK